MNWLARLKNIEIPPEVEPTKPTQEAQTGGFVGFVGSILAPVQKTGGGSVAANDPEPDPTTTRLQRGLSSGETTTAPPKDDTHTARLARFTDKGLSLDDSEALADRLAIRDSERDDRRICLECTHLRGAGAWRCGNWEIAGVAIRASDAQLPGEMVQLLQRCDGFTGALG